CDSFPVPLQLRRPRWWGSDRVPPGTIPQPRGYGTGAYRRSQVALASADYQVLWPRVERTFVLPRAGCPPIRSHRRELVYIRYSPALWIAPSGSASALRPDSSSRDRQGRADNLATPPAISRWPVPATRSLVRGRLSRP